jgi:hypothetical protein
MELFLQRGARIANTRIYLGPAIGVCCYKVDIDIANLFDNEAKIKLVNQKWKVDLQKQIIMQLIDLGILSSNIQSSKLCTFESNYCHSYRQEGSSAGRMYAIMGLK